MNNTYTVDDNRLGIHDTGIYIRAQHKGRFDSFDIADLDKKSLVSFLRSRGETSEWAESVVLHLLGHQIK